MEKCERRRVPPDGRHGGVRWSPRLRTGSTIDWYAVAQEATLGPAMRTLEATT